MNSVSYGNEEFRVTLHRSDPTEFSTTAHVKFKGEKPDSIDTVEASHRP